MGRTPAEECVAILLDSWSLPFEEQVKFAGHRIDFTVDVGGARPVLLDVNGDRWHRLPKIVACDVVKLTRVLEAGGIPLAVWWSVVQRKPDEVLAGVRAAAEGRLTRWDWAARPQDLSPVACERAELLLAKGGQV